MANKEDVQKLAKALDDLGRKLPQKQQHLLKCLLSRGAYTETRANKRLVVGMTGHLGADDIKQAVIDALSPVVRNLPIPIEGWARYSPWVRHDGWARDGYWALGMGLPPTDLMHPDGPDLPGPGIDPRIEGPDPGPTGPDIEGPGGPGNLPG